MNNHNQDEIRIGMIGFGYIASCVYRLIQEQNDYIASKIGKRLHIAKIADKDANKLQKDLPGLSAIAQSRDAADILEDPDIDIVVELIGGIVPAYDFVSKALEGGKYVVTANKDLIANKGKKLFDLAQQANVDILFEASVCGGIPIIGPLKSSLASNHISKIVGVVNGTTNYILTRMEKDKLSFDQALRMAQDLGYAERDPSADIEGYDAACKLAILSSIAFNSRVVLDDVYREGITSIKDCDINNAREMGYRIKLLAIGRQKEGKITVKVHPALVPQGHILASIEDTYNAVYVYGNYVDQVMSYGRGAGDRPTASSVVGDIIKIARRFDRDRKGPVYGCSCSEHKELAHMDDDVSKFYLLMDVVDKPGVLAKIARVFGDYSVSIQSMIQKQAEKEGTARLIFITHEVLNKNLDRSMHQVANLDVVQEVLSVIRVEDLN